MRSLRHSGQLARAAVAAVETASPVRRSKRPGRESGRGRSLGLKVESRGTFQRCSPTRQSPWSPPTCWYQDCAALTGRGGGDWASTRAPACAADDREPLHRVLDAVGELVDVWCGVIVGGDAALILLRTVIFANLLQRPIRTRHVEDLTPNGPRRRAGWIGTRNSDPAQRCTWFRLQENVACP